MARTKLFDPVDYVEVTVHFKCNLACAHCMIEGTMDWLRPETDAQLEQIFADNARHKRWTALTLTGAEVTLRRDLPALARAARVSGFEHVRIQTHGMRLADLDYCKELTDAGVDEFFVSVTAADAVTHDAITGVPGSFGRTLQGLENLDRFPAVSVLTNTVITRRSYRQLPDLVRCLGHLRQLVQMEFWGYWPMRETDDKDLIVSHLDTLPYLRAAIGEAHALGRVAETKNFPECLLGPDRAALDNSQPKLVIDPEFWPEFMRNGFHQCMHRSYCSSQSCLGLNTAYVAKYGWHADVLVPFGQAA